MAYPNINSNSNNNNNNNYDLNNYKILTIEIYNKINTKITK